MACIVSPGAGRDADRQVTGIQQHDGQATGGRIKRHAGPGHPPPTTTTPTGCRTGADPFTIDTTRRYRVLLLNIQ